MAETVTITTFLELKDNMSAGLGKVEAALKKIGGAQASQTKADKEQAKAKREQEKAAEKLAKVQQRAARFEEQAAKRRQREFDANAKKAQAASDRAWREMQRQEAAKRTEAIKTQAAISRAHLQAQADRRKAQVEQERTARRLAKAQEREQRQIAKAMLGPKYDPAARARQQVRDSGQMFGPKYDPLARAQQQMRAQERARRQADRDIMRAKKDFQRWGAQEAKAAERLERQKANAAIRELRRVEAERNRAARAEQRRQRDLARQQAQAKADRADFVGKAGAAMFGPSLGGIISAFQKSPQAAMQLGALALLEAGLGAVRQAGQLAFNTIKSLIEKTYEVSARFEVSIRGIANTLQAMNISPGFATSTKKANELYEQLRTMAATLPGETQDYIDVFKLGLPMALAQGERDIKRFADVSAKFTAFAIDVGQMDMQQTGRDLARIIQGRALSTTAMFRKLQTMPALGMMEAKDWNKLLPTERIKLLYEAVGQASTGFEDMKHSADAVMGTFKSLVDMIFFQKGGSPLFQSVLRIVERINRILQDNNNKITTAVSLINQRLGWALEGAAIKISGWVTSAISFVDQLRTADSIIAKVARTAYRISKAMGGGPATWAYDLAKETVQTGRQAAEADERARAIEKRTQADTAIERAGRAGETLLLRAASAAGLPAADQTAAFEELAKSPEARAVGGRAFEAALSVYGKLPTERVQELWDVASTPIIPRESRDSTRTQGAPKERASTINDFRFSKFDIRQEFAEGFDPDRIAVAFASDLAKLGEMRMQSAYAPLYAVQGG